MAFEITLRPRQGRIHTSLQPTFAADESGDIILDAAQFADGSEQILYFATVIPGSYASGSQTIKSRWRTPASGGNARLQVITTCANNGESLSVSGAGTEETQAADATGGEISESTHSGHNSGTARELMRINYRRDGADASDILSAVLNLDSITISGTANPDFTRSEIWVPARRMIPGGGAVRGTVGNGFFASTINFPNASTTYAEFSFEVPPNYGGGGINVFPYVCPDFTLTGNFQWRIDHVAVQTGESWDQALTSGTAYTTEHSNATFLRIGTSTSSISGYNIAGPFASGDRVTIRLSRLGGDASDTNTGEASCFGCLVDFEIINKNPQVLYFDPVSGALPAGSTSEVTVVSGTNVNLPCWLVPDGEDHTLSLRGVNPDSWDATAVLDIDVVSESTGDWYMSLDYSNPAAGSDPDPALTNIAAATKACTAGQLTRFTFDISTGLADNDNINLNINSLNSDVSHTAGRMYVVSCKLRHGVEDPA